MAQCTLVARKINNGLGMIKAQGRIIVLAWAFVVERVTGIEPALSAWEVERPWLPVPLTWQSGRS